MKSNNLNRIKVHFRNSIKNHGILMSCILVSIRIVSLIDIFSWLSKTNEKEFQLKKQVSFEVSPFKGRFKSLNKPLNPSKWNKHSITDVIVMFKFILAIAIFNHPSIGGIEIYLSIFMLSGTVISAPRAILLRKERPKIESFARAFYLGIINLGEIVVHFALYYKIIITNPDNKFEVVSTMADFDYIMMAVGTVTTASFYRFPRPEEIEAWVFLEKIMVSQTLICFGFIIFVLSSNIGGIGSEKSTKEKSD